MSTPSPTGSQVTLSHGEKAQNEKQAHNRFNEDATLNENHAQLPSGAQVNANGVPTYMGLCGSTLIWAITVAASFG